VNVLKSHLGISTAALLESGVGQHEISRRLGRGPQDGSAAGAPEAAARRGLPLLPPGLAHGSMTRVSCRPRARTTALPAPPHSEVTVRVYESEIEVLDRAGEMLRRHQNRLARTPS
jgi:hypothetical protein